MLRRNWLFLLVLTFLFLPTVARLDATDQRIAALKVIDSDPYHGRPLGLREDVAFHFDRRLDCESAEAAFQVEPTVAGALTCDGYQLTFSPADAYVRDSDYTFTLHPTVLALDGTPLLDAHIVTYTTAGFLQVLETLPSDDAVQVPVDSEITVVFDRPVIPLLTSASAINLPEPLLLSPEVNGAGEWINSAVYIFTPAEPLQKGTTYTASIKQDLQAIDGSVLGAPFRWTFQTAMPRLLSVFPRPANRVLLLEPRFQLRFDQKVDRASIENSLYFRARAGEEISGQFTWSEDEMGLMFEPDRRLQLEAVYELGFDDEIGDALDLRAMNGRRHFTFFTIPKPSIIATDPEDGDTYASIHGFTLRFASPMNIETLRDKIFIDPPPATAPTFQYNDSDHSYSASFVAHHKTLYTVHVAAGMEDIYGHVIDEESSFSYSTLTHVSSLGLVVYDHVGLYNANAESINVPVYHGDIESIDFDLHRVPIADFVGYSPYSVWYDAFEYYHIAEDTLLRSWRMQVSADENLQRYHLDAWGEHEGTGLISQFPVTVADEQGEMLERGLYFLRLSSPDIESYDQFNDRKEYFLLVADASLTVKRAKGRLLVWATDLRTGMPIAGEPINVYGVGGKAIASGITDANGIAQLVLPSDGSARSTLIVLMDSDLHFGLASTKWRTYPFAVGQYSRNYGWTSGLSTYIYTDRPIYRPGETAYFRGMVRDKDDVRYFRPSQDTVTVEIRDARHNTFFEEELPINEFGSFSGSSVLPENTSLGEHVLTVSMRENDYDEMREYARFMVAEYRLPEYQLQISAADSAIVQGESASFELEGRYFFGGKVTDAAVDYSASWQPYHFRFQGEGPYDFSDRRQYAYDDDDEHEYGEAFHHGQTTTDAAGTAAIQLDSALPSGAGSRILQLEAGLRDESDQTIFSRSSVVVHQSLVYIGARAENYISRAGEDSAINIIAVDWDSEAVANQTINVQALERRWSSEQKQDLETGRTRRVWHLEEIPVASGIVKTAVDGKARFEFTPQDGGSFKVIIASEDSLGNKLNSATYVWVSGSSYVSWGRDSDAQVALIPERETYQVGEKAKVLITSPFQGVTEALISIERGSVMDVERVTMRNNSLMYEFEILPEHAPTIFVNAFLLKPANEVGASADYRVGVVRLDIDISQKALNIEVEAASEAVSPQETISYKIRVTDFKGDPVVAEVGIAVTDLAALSLLPPNSEPLLDLFYGRQGLNVGTSSSQVQALDEASLVLYAPMCCFGGGASSYQEPFDLRSEFVGTPFWNPAIVTDSKGEATIEVRLPDNLTTWRLDARAWTAAHDGNLLLGETTLDLLSTRPLLIRPVTPRFFITGDEPTLAAVINNNTDEGVRAQVSIENVAGLTPLGDTRTRQLVMIPARGKTRIDWQMRVEADSAVAPHFAVRSVDGVYNDASISPVAIDERGSIPVYRYDVPETVGTSGSLREGGIRVEAILVPDEMEINRGELVINLEKSLAGVLIDSLTAMNESDGSQSDCNTTIVNRFLPGLVAFRALTELGLAAPELKDKLDRLVGESLTSLSARQTSNGGWSWCHHYRSHSVTSAYVLIGLAEAQRQGYTLDTSTIKWAQRYLVSQLIEPGFSATRWQLNRQAFLLYALADSGAADVEKAHMLFEHRERLNLDAIAFLARTIFAINPDDQMRLDVLSQMMMNSAITRSTGAFFQERFEDRLNWSSDLRSTALALNALVQLRPESELLPNIVRHLATMREANGVWRSQQETVWSIIALTNWMLESGELHPTYSFSIAKGDAPLLVDDANSQNVLDAVSARIDVSELVPGESNLISIGRTEGDGALYYTAHLTLELPVPHVRSIDNGIQIARKYSLQEDRDKKSIDRARTGETVAVRLTIVAPDSLHYVKIEDYLPAGTEAINARLATSQKTGTRAGGDRVDHRRAGWGWWLFDQIEFHDEKVVIYADYLPRGVYEYVYYVRPTAAGLYNVIPPMAQEVYFPEVYGRGDGMRFTVTR